ncbi:hypothetical protein BBF96_00275 [Anoxybacter fermentans]|uniref:Uncharacterized protein n=1 Tax=Anoxybacter fermentans TaxID=1323375 RepID=A0A3Q9HNE8_9FIRM|nr:hypothetical protein [Anoxybacter fermentans]AZR71973.1 hypothetical protein BBF96_00275 [Anoxybacter fermentans]
MIKKYINFYIESIKLAFKYPQFILFFLVNNLVLFLNFFNLSEIWFNIIFPTATVLKLGAMGGIGYVTIRLLRSGKVPEKIFLRGVVQYYWLMLKYTFLQLFIWTITGILPLYFLRKYSVVPPFIDISWYWVMEFLFIFLIYEAIFWEDKGISRAYRMRNIFLLDRFEWLLPVYLIVKLPYFIVRYLAFWGSHWLFSGIGILIIYLVIACFDWVHNIFTFKIYGADRIQVAIKMEERIKASVKRIRKKKK